MRVQSRIVYLPLAFEDSGTLDAIQRYRETVRPSAPWLPSNIDFIQRINGLQSRDEVKQIVFDASYLILGLGDVYLGAPCALPIDPRHRLVTSKYNPARTFTAEGTVGIGGVYMCIYGMDSPGGYQLIGRTLPIWNTFNRNKAFQNGNPWLLRFFDQVKFYSVDENQLTVERQQFRQGNFDIRIIEDNYFDLGQYYQFIQQQSTSINEFMIKQAKAFAEEISHWENYQVEENQIQIENIQVNIDEGLTNVYSDICGSVWKILVQLNDHVQINAPVIILEAMKMEIIIRSPINGTVSSILCHLGQLIKIKDILIQIK
jgi:urea carboxylase